MPTNWFVTKKMLSIVRKIARSRAFTWKKLWKSERVCKQLFSEYGKYLMHKIGQVKRELEVEDTSFYKSQL